MRPILALLLLAASPAAAESFDAWPRLVPRFPSTGGGGVIIDEYRPVVDGAVCRTDFVALMPDGAVHRNRVVFDAVPTQGGILCTNGRWRALDGDAEGTTPFRVFFRDGIAYAPPTR
jgi:hypothetical protein